MKIINIDFEKKYGKLKILKEEKAINEIRYVLCKCDCGNEKIINFSNIRHGKSKSCGCVNTKRITKLNKKHGLNGTPFYKSWRSAKERCYLEKNSNYKNYGGRGIIMSCERKDSFLQFLKDEYLNYCKAKLKYGKVQIDRINNNGDYEKGNIRWVSQSKNARNRRTNKIIFYKGEYKTMIDWSEIFNLKYSVFRYHINKGRTIEYILKLKNAG